MQLNQGWRMLNNEIIRIIPMLPHFISITHPHGSQAAQIMTYIWKHDFFLPSMREKIIGLQIKMSSGRFIEIICAYFPSTPINSWVWVFWLFDNVNILFAGCYVLTDLCTLKCFTNYFMRRTWKERKLKLWRKVLPTASAFSECKMVLIECTQFDSDSHLGCRHEGAKHIYLNVIQMQNWGLLNCCGAVCVHVEKLLINLVLVAFQGVYLIAPQRLPLGARGWNLHYNVL